MKLTKKSFRKWLESKPPRSVVGLARMSKFCPLAEFTGHECHPAYLIEDVYTPGFIGDAKADAWACNFMSFVDEQSVTKITAKRALAILDEC